MSDADIKLSAQPSDTIRGFYRTAEGRNFLRYVYQRYLARMKSGEATASFGDTKIASMIADDNKADQTGEVRLTRAALRRWADDDQTELWSKDQEKTQRVLRRLEGQMMLEPEIAEICEDRALTIHRSDTAHAFSNFFYGGTTLSRRQIVASLEVYEGIFETINLDEANLRSRGRTGSMSANFIKFIRPEGGTFLIFQEFTIDDMRLSDSRITFRRCGFAYCDDRRSLFKFTISHRDPKVRRIELLHRADEIYAPAIPADKDAETHDIYFKTHYSPIGAHGLDHSVQEFAHFHSEVIYRREEIRELIFINKHISGNMWNIPL